MKMKQIGTTTIDDFGRVLLQSEIRSMLGWQVGSQVDVYYADGNTALLQLAKETRHDLCDICDEAERHITIKGINICKGCTENILQLSSFKLV